jgi:ATP-dependent Clp protease adaptor protein ClpS
MPDNQDFLSWGKGGVPHMKLPGGQVGHLMSSYRNGSYSVRPPMYQVWLLQDDCTPVNFINHIISKFFYKTEEDVQKIMHKMSQEGQAMCGIFTRETAESKVIQVTEFSRSHAFPLKCIMRKEQSYVIKKS